MSGFDSYVHDPYLRPKDRYYYIIKDNVRERIEQAPLTLDPATGAISYAASYLRKNDFEQVGRKSNLWSNTVYLEGGLDFRPTKTTALKVNGEYIYSLGTNNGVQVLDN